MALQQGYAYLPVTAKSCPLPEFGQPIKMPAMAKRPLTSKVIAPSELGLPVLQKWRTQQQHPYLPRDLVRRLEECYSKNTQLRSLYESSDLLAPLSKVPKSALFKDYMDIDQVFD